MASTSGFLGARASEWAPVEVREAPWNPPRPGDSLMAEHSNGRGRQVTRYQIVSTD